jgi:predicted permease
MLDWLRTEVRYALRGLLKDRTFTALAMLSIGLGVGANSAIFSLVDQALFRRLPVREPEKLVLLSWNGSYVGNGWGPGNLLPHPMFRDLKKENTVFEGLFARHPTSVHWSMEGGATEPVSADIVSGNYFTALGVRPALGRLFDETDDQQPGAHPVVVVSHDYWKTRLGGRDDVVGRKALINSFSMTVVGVVAPGFRGVDWGEVPQLWIPTMMKKQATPDFDWLDDRRGAWLNVFGRLKPGISAAQAQAQLQPWFKAMLEADTRREGWPKVSGEQRAKFLASKLDVLPAAQGRSNLRGRLEQPLYVLLAATGLVLVLASLNVANLCLARAFARRKETALRLAIGAPRGRIVRQRLVESALLAVGGAGLGLLLAPLVSRGLVSFLSEPVDLQTGVNPRVFAFALAVALATGLLFGLVPALSASRTQPGATLKEEAGSLAGGLGLRKALVVGQIALALVLLVGAGLFVRTLANLRERGPGYDTTNLLTFRVDPQRSGNSKERVRAFMNELLAGLRARPEVQSAAISGILMLEPGGWSSFLTIDDRGQRIAMAESAHCNRVSPGFFDTLGARLLSGRGFDERDVSVDEERGFRAAVVNERFAKRYFGDRSPLGARLGFGTTADTKTEIEIVGVVATFSYRASGLREPEEQIYFPFFEGAPRGGSLFVRSRTESGAAMAAVRATVSRLDPTLPVSDLRTIDDQLDRALSNERLLAALAVAFAALALLLAAVGLYGVTSFVVAGRTREIGIRMALGATRGAASWMVVRDTSRLVLLGVALALPCAWALGRLVESQLFGVTALDGRTIAVGALVVTLAALAAAVVPARRASKLDPLRALRHS